MRVWAVMSGLLRNCGFKLIQGSGKSSSIKRSLTLLSGRKTRPQPCQAFYARILTYAKMKAPYGFPLSRLKTRRRLLLTTFTIPTLSAVATSRLQPTLQRQRCLYASRTTKRFTFCSSIFYHKPALSTSRRKTQTRHPIGYGRSGACLRYARAAA